MTNSIDLVTAFLTLIDEIYKLESKTAILDAPTQPIDFAGEATVKVMKVSMVGLGNYSRANGYPKGDITATWEAMTLTIERARQLSIDRMDNDESLGLILGNVMRMWMREKVAPEVDAIRFAKYAGTSGIATTTAAALTTSAGVLDAIDVASAALDDAEVPAEGRKLFISNSCYRLLKAGVSRILANENTVDRRVKMLDDIEIIPVPQGRFYTQVTLDAGSTSNAGGFTKTASTGRDINFELIYPPAVLQAVKLNNVKYFSPEINQSSDGHMWQHRLYHDAFVYDNKVLGVYLHKKDS